jgi:hypothetical protein
VSVLRVRAYNVLFGDALLISVPDEDDDGTEVTRHMMVDFGNALSTAGGEDEVFEKIVDNVLEVLDGDPLDLYVMSHEHLDHVQGPLFTSTRLQRDLAAREVWLPASAEPGYYDDHPDARQKKLRAIEAYEQIAAFVGADAGHPTLNTLMLNNNPRRTADCVDMIRDMKVGGDPPVYVHREMDLTGQHPFRRANIEVWAPEEDTSVYYGRFKRMNLGLTGSGIDDEEPGPIDVIPPPGVDAGAFYDLVSQRRTGLVENLFTIDKASNNSSIVFSLHWAGWVLLFSGDAEERSWQEMNKRNLLQPVHFLKVSHHGSHNGTPPDDLLDLVLPPVPPDAKQRNALVSTHPDAYASVPDEPTIAEVEARVSTLRRTTEADPGEFIDLEFADDD